MSKTGAIREQLGSAQMCNQILSQPIHINTAYKNMVKHHSSLPQSVIVGWSCNEKYVLNHILSTHKEIQP